MNKIPKVIHYCWFGGNELDVKSIECINSWKEKLCDYEIKRWDESNFDVNAIPFLKKAYEDKKWAFVSDYARLKIIYENGGIYLDTDVEVLKNFDELLSNEAFFGFELGTVINTGIGFGAKKGNEIVKKNMEFYENLSVDKKFKYVACPDITTNIMKEYGLVQNDEFQQFDSFVVFPSEYFCPMDYYTGDLFLTNNSFSIHRYSMSWVGEKGVFYYNLQKKLIKIFGKKLGIKISDFIKIPHRINNRLNRLKKSHNKIGIFTIIDDNNYGNRLQNFAVQQVLKKYNKEIITIDNVNDFLLDANHGSLLILNLKKIIKILSFNKKGIRYKNFRKFNKNIRFSKKTVVNKNYLKYMNTFNKIFVGSDQIWNPNYRLFDIDLLKGIDSNKRYAFSASFGVNDISENSSDKIKNELLKFNMISVREDQGKKIVDKITNRNDTMVLIDPTMLLSSDDWDAVSNKPKMLNSKKYILNYFLGNLSSEKEKQINKIALENNCEIINILDKNSPFYCCGPSEFLYLEKNAFLICTDSFHSSVFAIIYNKPFVIFDRDDKNVENMGSRLDTLIEKFKLSDRRYNGKSITSKNLNHDYSEAYNILEEEKNKCYEFLDKAFDLKK